MWDVWVVVVRLVCSGGVVMVTDVVHCVGFFARM